MNTSNKLFTVHVWTEDIGNGRKEWRGRVSSLPVGTVMHFRRWNDLIEHMKQQLGEHSQETDREVIKGSRGFAEKSAGQAKNPVEFPTEQLQVNNTKENSDET